MNETYARDLDLNLLRVFLVVAESGSVTEAAARLYLTQPAVSAALRRLHTAVGAPLFVRRGRGLALTSRAEILRQRVRPHLVGLLDAALAPPRFDPASSDRTVRLGLSDTSELWLLPALLRVLGVHAPRMRVIAVPVQFRTVGAALGTGGLDLALTVADELPAGVRRQAVLRDHFVCLHDPRASGLRGTISERQYFAREHVIVSYNGDLRGIVEDLLGKTRRVRCSVASFASLGGLIDGSALLATVPSLVARQARALRPHLAASRLPFTGLAGAPMELLWPAAADDDPAGAFLRAQVVALAARAQAAISSGSRGPGRRGK